MKKISVILCGIMIVLLCSCNNISESEEIDQTVLSEIVGSYHIAHDSKAQCGDYWALDIFDNYDKKRQQVASEDSRQENLVPYLIIYDAGAGNPGVEGVITNCTEDSIQVEINQDDYEQLPNENWKLNHKKYLELTWQYNDDQITLKNHGSAVMFDKEIYDDDGNLVRREKKEIDQKLFDSVCGSYSATYHQKEYTLKIYNDDSETENEYFLLCHEKEEILSGRIIEFNDSFLRIAYDGIGYAAMPEDGFWNENYEYFDFTLKISVNQMQLTNSGNSLLFTR